MASAPTLPATTLPVTAAPGKTQANAATSVTSSNEVRRRLLGAGVGAMVLGASGLRGTTANAQEIYPNRPISIVVGFPPGTATDSVARMLAERLAHHFGQPVTVDNKPGVGGSLGAGAAARSKPDGYTLLVGASAPLAINPHVYSKLPYDSLTDFAPIGVLTWLPYMLVVSPSIPANTLQEFLALARDKPGTITYGSTGNGTTSHLIMEVLGARAKVQFSHVPYKGSAQVQADIMGGQVACSFDTLPSSLALVRSGKLKALAVSNPQRAEAAPEVPTVIEQGFPGFDLGAWLGLIAVAGTPPAILDKLSQTLMQIQAEPDFRRRIMASGAENRASASREEFTAFIRKDYESWGKIVRDFGVKAS